MQASDHVPREGTTFARMLSMLYLGEWLCAMQAGIGPRGTSSSNLPACCARAIRGPVAAAP
eukprot:4433584-Alexandrium_andersonii.AAC.1